MRVAGVRLEDGSAAWVDTAGHAVALLDGVTVRLAQGEAEGSVFMIPEQMVQGPPAVDGAVVAVHPREVVSPLCQELPGTDMPALGSWLETERGGGTVTSIDAVRRTVTISQGEVEMADVPLERITP